MQKPGKLALTYGIILIIRKWSGIQLKSLSASYIVVPHPLNTTLSMVPLLLALLDYLVDHLAISWHMSIIETLITMAGAIARWCIGTKAI
jgi:hypothetical protein